MPLLHPTPGALTVKNYFTSLCGACFRQNLQYFFISRRSGSFFLFFIVE